MQTLIQKISRTQWVQFWCLMLIQSVVWSRFLTSVCLWAFAVTAVFGLHYLPQVANNAVWWRKFRLRANKYFFRNWWQQPVFVWLTIPFFIFVVSYFWSSDTGYWLHKVRLRLPFLVLPMAFASLPMVGRRYFEDLLAAFVAMMSLSSAIVVVNYLLHFREFTDRLGRGVPIALMKEHITFSLMTVLAVFVAMELWRSNYTFLSFRRTKMVLAVLAAWLFLAVHILSVRTGIVTLYLASVAYLVYYIWLQKAFLRGAVALLVLAMLPFLFYATLPSLRKRIDYTRWDWQQYAAGNLVKKSDSERLTSLQMGWKVLQANPFMGVGAGDIMHAVGEQYQTYHPDLEVRDPHSEWLYVAVCVGWLGLLAFAWAFFYPLWHLRHSFSPLLLVLYIVLTSGITLDFILESALGTAFVLFFICLFLKKQS